MSTRGYDAVTVTLNPAVDETVFVDRLTTGAVNRARSLRRQAGGKGINVAALLADAGLRVAVTGLLGRENPGVFDRLFRSRGLEDRFVRIPGETRTGIKIVDRAAAETTDLNLPGLEPSPDDLAALETALGECVAPGVWVALSGSLPPGVEPDYLAALVATVHALGGRVAVDTSGPPLAAAVAAGVDLVKPNRDELAELCGRTLDGFADTLEEAAALRRRGLSHVIVSLGHEGAMFLTPDGNVMAGAPPVAVTSTVGAGDALLAGYLAALVAGRPVADRAREASVFAWCALESLDRTLVDEAEREARAAKIPVQPLPH
jgi:1-phosphofructokinase